MSDWVTPPSPPAPPHPSYTGPPANPPPCGRPPSLPCVPVPFPLQLTKCPPTTMDSVMPGMCRYICHGLYDLQSPV